MLVVREQEDVFKILRERFTRGEGLSAKEVEDIMIQVSAQEDEEIWALRRVTDSLNQSVALLEQIVNQEIPPEQAQIRSHISTMTGQLEDLGECMAEYVTQTCPDYLEVSPIGLSEYVGAVNDAVAQLVGLPDDQRKKKKKVRIGARK